MYFASLVFTWAGLCFFSITHANPPLPAHPFGDPHYIGSFSLSPSLFLAGHSWIRFWLCFHHDHRHHRTTIIDRVVLLYTFFSVSSFSGSPPVFWTGNNITWSARFSTPIHRHSRIAACYSGLYKSKFLLERIERAEFKVFSSSSSTFHFLCLLVQVVLFLLDDLALPNNTMYSYEILLFLLYTQDSVYSFFSVSSSGWFFSKILSTVVGVAFLVCLFRYGQFHCEHNMSTSQDQSFSLYYFLKKNPDKESLWICQEIRKTPLLSFCSVLKNPCCHFLAFYWPVSVKNGIINITPTICAFTRS